ncbi:MAG: hypothetical protein V4732_13405 [Pseudomonadota bacterium]
MSATDLLIAGKSGGKQIIIPAVVNPPLNAFLSSQARKNGFSHGNK